MEVALLAPYTKPTSYGGETNLVHPDEHAKGLLVPERIRDLWERGGSPVAAYIAVADIQLLYDVLRS